MPPLDKPAKQNGYARGFANPVTAAQSTFREVMMAMAEPGTLRNLKYLPEPPTPLDPALAAVALTMLDHETSVFLDHVLATADAVSEYIRFHTGARVIADPGEAAFVLVADASALPPFDHFAQGSLDYPDRSATLLVAVNSLEMSGGFTISGPGIATTARLSIDPLPAGFADQWAANRAQFPLGVDVIFASKSRIAALPRSTSLTP